ncbi:MAG: hypothetical protein LBL34_06745 [Clostridiales bacterium]|jgi:pilin isopeptide linkage protein|nr:hypothetical protein [Clostridiales bacterium]
MKMPNGITRYQEPVWQNTVQASSRAELIAALSAVGITPTIIELLADINLGGTALAVPNQGIVKLTSGNGLIYSISAQNSSRVIHNSAGSTLYLENIILRDGRVANYNGGAMDNLGTVVMGEGSVIESCYSGAYGGGIYNRGNSVIINGGVISNCTSNNQGGGIYNPADGTVVIISGEISYNTARYSGGGIYNQGTLEILGGQIYSNGAGSEDGGGIQNFYAKSFAMSGGEIFSNYARDGGGISINNTKANISGASDIDENTADRDGGGISIVGGASVTISGDVVISNNIANRNGGGIYIPCDILENLVIYPDVVFSENSAAYRYNRRAEHLGVYTTNITSNVWTSPFTQGYNGYDIAYPCGEPYATPVEVVFEGEKRVAGAALPGGRFDFGLFDTGGNLILKASADSNGVIKFPAFEITGAGTTNYTIREISQTGGGWTIDSTVFPAIVTATNPGTGALTATIDYPNGTPVFTNTYSSAPASDSVAVYKETLQWNGKERAFSFGLFDQNGALIETAGNSDGVVEFSEIQYTSPGIYNYTVRETTQGGGGWTVDPNSYSVTVTVTDDGLGQLVANVSYPEGQPTFVNTYIPPKPVIVKVPITKTAVGETLQAGQFTFEAVSASDPSLIVAGTNDESGNAALDLMFNHAGTYAFNVIEAASADSDWTTDSRSYPLTVTVTDDGSGQLVAAVDYPEGQPTFVNTYIPPKLATVEIPITKTAVGGTLQEGQFTFEAVSDSDPSMSAVGTNDESGNATLILTFDEPGAYELNVSETTQSGDGWTVDSAVFPAIVTVADDGSGQLTATASYPNGTPRFVNTYNESLVPEPVKVMVFAKKRVCGACICADMFTFGLFDNSGAEVARAVNDACGCVEFTINVNSAGVFNYTVRELNESGNGWIMDSKSYPVTVIAKVNSSGALGAFVRYPQGYPTFVNRLC